MLGEIEIFLNFGLHRNYGALRVTAWHTVQADPAPYLAGTATCTGETGGSRGVH